MPAASRALIVGGGIGGLTAGIALRQQEISVDLVEIKKEWTVYGVGIMQPSNQLRALDKIGLARPCVEQGGSFPGWKAFDANGRFLGDSPLSNAPAPAYPAVNGITRPLLHQLLSDSAINGGVDVKLGVTVAASTEDFDHVEVTFTDGRRERYDVVIGADGAHSQTRSRLFGSALRPQAIAQAVWRYNLPRPPEVAWGHTYFGPHSKVGLVPLSPTLMYLFVVTEEPLDARYPVDALASLMRERLQGYGGLIAALREQIRDSAGVVYRPLELLRVPAPWYVGRTILIGDAAHLTSPHLAQGASMAIEDAVLLAELLGAHDHIPAAFDEFMRRRHERGLRVIDSSHQLALWELAEWRGTPAPDADPIGLFKRASQMLLEDY
jgi:2-polyprenyl-6-methoxyphenol hydroxylase-like FAD-dependent oxidoreductase